MTEKIELLPCPFCGEKENFYPLNRRIPYRIKCGECDAESGAGSTIDYASRLWNTRAPTGVEVVTVEQICEKVYRNPHDLTGIASFLQHVARHYPNGIKIIP